jgi:hypothetical protein
MRRPAAPRLLTASVVAAAVVCPAMTTSSQETKSTAPARPAEKAGGEKSLEGFLRQANLTFARNEQGVYKFTVEIGDNALVMYGREVTMGNDRSGTPVKIIYMWTMVMTLPEDFRPPAAMLRRMAQINDQIYIGKVGLAERAVTLNTSFWLRTGDFRTFLDEILIANDSRNKIRKELLTYLSEEK